MTIRYITSGNEPRAKGLLGEGRHQLSILRNAMSFQGLKQLQRVVRFSDGTIIKCSSCFGQDTVNVFVPPYMPVIEKIPFEIIKQEYEFSFKITRDDGTVIDETTLDNIIIIGENGGAGFSRSDMPEGVGVVGKAWRYDPESSDAQYWTLTDGVWNYWNTDDPDYDFGFSYDTNTQIWTVPFYEWLINKEDYSAGDVNPEIDTFWCLFDCDDSISFVRMSLNEVGYTYKTADWWIEEDRFKADFYEVKVPMWKTENTHNGISYSGLPVPISPCFSGYINSPVTRNLTVYSSVEYKVTFKTLGQNKAAYYGSYPLTSCHVETCEYCQSKAIPGWICSQNTEDVEATSSNGDYTTNLGDVPINSSIIITPSVYGANNFSMSFTFIGDNIYQITRECGGLISPSTLIFGLPFMFFSFYGSMTASVIYE